MKISFIVTAYKEAATIKKTVWSLLDSFYSGYSEQSELITVIPDQETINAVSEEIERLGYKNWFSFKDDLKGKPNALNLAIEQTSGDILVFTDGDVYFSKNAVAELINEFQKYPKISAVTGRQFSTNDKKTFFGYISHLFVEAAAMERSKMSHGNIKHMFFPMSGYIMAIKKEVLDFKIPEEVLVDDAYISYKLLNAGKIISYNNNAGAYIKYSNNLGDYLKQKIRSTGGFMQLKNYIQIPKQFETRTIKQDLKLIFFPFKYAHNFREFLYTIMLFPLRGLLWAIILYLHFFNPKKLQVSWKRVESTK